MSILQLFLPILLIPVIHQIEAHEGHGQLEGHTAGFQSCFADFAIVLDSSGSVQKENWLIMLDFVKNFTWVLHHGETENQVAVVIFGHKGYVMLDLKSSRIMDYKERNDTIDAITYLANETNIADAFRQVRTKVFTPQGGDRPHFRNIVILLSDGKPTREINATYTEAQRLREDGTLIFTIGIGGEGVDFDFLERIASDPSYVQRVTDFKKLMDIFLDLVKRACSETTRCRAKDVALLLDSSGSIGYNHFQMTKTFAKILISNLPLSTGPDSNQVGLITYSTTSTLLANLGDITDEAKFNNTVNSMHHFNQRTNISGAIRLARMELFAKQSSSRLENSDVIVLVTDGQDNTEPHLTIEESELAKQAGIRIFTIGVGPYPDMLTMMQISTSPGYFHTFIAETYTELVANAGAGDGETIYDLICKPDSTYPPQYYSSSEAECSADVYIVLDSSGSVSSVVFSRVIEALVSSVLSDITDMHIEDRRVSVITFSSSFALEHITRNDYNTKEELAQGIRSLMHYGGSSGRVSHALDIVNNRLQSTATGQPVQVFLLSASSATTYSFTNAGNVVIIPYAVSLDYDVSPHSLGLYLPNKPDGFAFKEPTYNDMENFFIGLWTSSCLDTAQTNFSCNFDDTGSDPLCGAKNFANLFTLQSGKTPSHYTGPEEAFSLPNYIFMECTGRTPGTTAVFELPELNSRGPGCLHFMYHMYGFHTGTLRIVTNEKKLDNQDTRYVVWMISGPQGKKWIHAKAELTMHQAMRVTFEAIRGFGYSSDIALDSITLQKGPCQINPRYMAILAEYEDK